MNIQEIISMKRNVSRYAIAASLVVIFSVLFYGCINYEQRTKLNYDGSGTMQIHYWAKESDVQWLGSSNFGFDEEKIREQYESDNITIKGIKIETKDSLKHAFVDLAFKDFNKTDEAKGFEKNLCKFEEKDGNKVLSVVLKSDSSSTGMGMEQYKLTYVFEMPGDVISSNATKVEGNVLTWEYRLSDLTKDIHLTATVRGGSKSPVLLISLVVAAVILLFVVFAVATRKKPSSPQPQT
jgi:hypothetical protein